MAGANSIEAVLKGINKQAKKNIAAAGVRDDDPKRLPTGMFTLDLAIGGGLPHGRISLFYGAESAMKTTMALKAIASAQRRLPDRTAAFVDIEGLLDRTWAKKMGVDVDKLAHIIPENAEQACDIIEALMTADDVSIVVADSLAALQTQDELQKSVEEFTPGKQSMAINKLYRKVTHALNSARVAGAYGPIFIAINQTRANIGGGKYEDPDKLPGGKAFMFASSMTIRLNGSDVMLPSVHKTLPAYRKLSVICKKNKVPILAKKCELQVALMPIEEFNLDVGQLNTWPTVLSYLKSHDLFAKSEDKGGGWVLTHADTGELEKFKTQDELKAKCMGDVSYYDRVQENLISVVLSSGDMIDAE